MPFTFSHPAIVLPLTYLPRRYFSLTGLVIGSLTPDFEYFLRMQVKSTYSHTLDGLFWFDLPLGLLLAFTYHNIVRNPLTGNLPIPLKSRFVNFQQFDWNSHFSKNWSIITLSLLIGAASHLFWDSFTHPNGYFVERIPILQRSINWYTINIPILKILQHTSTVLGGIAITWAIYQIPAIPTIQKKSFSTYWTIVTGIAVTIIASRLLAGLTIDQYGNVIVTGISAVLISLVMVSWIFKRFSISK